MDNVLEKEGVTCFLHTRIIGAKTKDGEIKSIQCVDDEGIFQVEARVFVDATGDANLAHLSGQIRSGGMKREMYRLQLFHFG